MKVFFNMNYMMSFFSLKMNVYSYNLKKEKYKKALSTRIFLLKKKYKHIESPCPLINENGYLLLVM